MTITDEARATNGHAKGRAAVELPTITLSSGYTIGLRRQPMDAMPKAQAAAQHELEESKPRPPMQHIETGPGEFHDIENESDPTYQEELLSWRAEVAVLSSQKLLLLMQRLALVFDIDQERLRDTRETYAALGMELPSDDRAAYLSYVLAPTHADQARLFEEVYGRGLPTEAQVALHRRMFPGNMEGHAA